MKNENDKITNLIRVGWTMPIEMDVLAQPRNFILITSDRMKSRARMKRQLNVTQRSVGTNFRRHFITTLSPSSSLSCGQIAAIFKLKKK